MNRTGRSAIVVSALLLAGVAPASAQSEEGKQAYSDAGCVMCHGPRGRGADGPRLVPLGRTFEGLARIVREGIGEMPPLDTGVVTAEQLDLVYEYLTALSGDTPAVGAEAPGALLPTAVAPAGAPSEEGKQAYSEGGCVLCHGPRGRGASGPRLVPFGRTHNGLARIIREGIGEMPPFDTDEVSAGQLDLIYDYLTALSGDTPAVGAEAPGAVDDPNDLLLRGIAAFVRPAELGGDLEAAERELRGAVDLLARDSTLTEQQAEAYAWLGQVLAKMDRPDEAKQIYDLAIELRPEFPWVRDVLLPALQAK